MTQKRITIAGKLLRPNGELKESGYATNLILQYNKDVLKRLQTKEKIKLCVSQVIFVFVWFLIFGCAVRSIAVVFGIVAVAVGLFFVLCDRIKEWDYYLIMNSEYGISFTVANLGYLSIVGCAVLDFKTKKFYSDEEILPLHKISLPKGSSAGIIAVQGKRVSLSIQTKKNGAHIETTISLKFPTFCGQGLKADLNLKHPVEDDSMMICSSWKIDRSAFYYNQKKNCLEVEGTFDFGDREFSPNSKDGHYGVLDWGRGVWTYSNDWYWSSISFLLENDIRCGWNLGYGFSDRSEATENMLFYDGVAHKLTDIEFVIPKNESNDKFDYCGERSWIIKSVGEKVDGQPRFYMEFEPVVDRNSDTNFLVIRSFQHQVFGKFSGYFLLGNGRKVEIENVMGFAEHVFNRW